jgi:MEMO1 family protein
MSGKGVTIRQPAVSGLFYPGSASELRKSVEEYLHDAVVPRELANENVRAIIVPHAGYIYSGQTAAYAYNIVRDRKFDAVVIVGPSHRKYFRGISLYRGDAYRTPLGDVPIDTELRDDFVDENARIVLSDEGHIDEHSIEVQLPFLQLLLGEFHFIPVVMGDQTRSFVDTLARKLDEVLHRKNVLLVASTDLSHYYPYESAVNIDKGVIDSVTRYDQDGLMYRLEQRHVEACGGGPMVAVMQASKLLGCTKSTVLHYCNSGDVSGDKSAVVGYLAASMSMGLG